MHRSVLPLLLWFVTPSALAGTLHVGPGQTYATIAAGVSAANSGDTVIVHAGTYTLSTTVTLMDNVTVEATGTVVVQGTNVDLFTASRGPVTIRGLHLQPTGGTGVRQTAGTLTLEDVEVSGNTASSNTAGAALHLTGSGSATLRRVALHDNTARAGNLLAPSYGGCVYAAVAFLTVESSTFDNCRGQYGGAMYVDAGNLTVRRSTFNANLGGASMAGGAIYLEDGTSGTIEESTFVDNAAGDGGGIYASAALTVRNSTFRGNSITSGGVFATASGGAIHAYCETAPCAPVTLEDNDFTDNEASIGAGAYLAVPDHLTITRNTFCANTASAEGGGVWITSRATSWSARNNVFAENTATTGAGLFCNRGDGVTSASGGVLQNNTFAGNVRTGTGGTVDGTDCGINLRNNIIAGSTGTGLVMDAGSPNYNLWYDNDTDRAGVAYGAQDVKAANPRFVSWSQDGSCANDDFSLQAGSPALNAGDPSILDPDGTRSDIGAFGGPNAPDTVDTDGDGVGDARDCAPNDAAIFPGQIETCDGRDQDCNGVADEPAPPSAPLWYRDNDGDGHGAANVSKRACSKPDGYVNLSDDCNDNRVDIAPSSPEFCDGIDNDCDGRVDADDDADDLPEWFPDNDGDGFGRNVANAPRGCEGPEGTVSNKSDCDDGAADVNPDGVEVCDGVDQNCDGKVDNRPAEGLTFYVDADGDGWGDSAEPTEQACRAPKGYAIQDGDCDDDDRDVHPLAPEPCDPPRDLNCDGASGEDDNDNDGFDACEECDDFDSSRFPGAEDEWYDGVISDCDHTSDYDRDGDGFDAFVGGGRDCDDKDEDIHPGATDIPDDGDDQDCDGEDADADDAPTDEGGSDDDTTDDVIDLDVTGSECDGCATGGAGSAWALAALSALAVTRRRRR